MNFATHFIIGKKSLIIAGIFLLLFFLNINIAAATTETFTTAGASTWTAPEYVYSVTVETWGGGGGSGGGTDTGLPGGSGGGGGAYASRVISVTPGTIYNYEVGAGGPASGVNGSSGGLSEFTGDAGGHCAARGGYNGLDNGGSNSNSLGGTTTSPTDGTTKKAGGAGVVPTGTSGGGGGESASPSVAGNDAIDTAGGTGTAGTDGSAGQALGVAGVAGNNPGAGAGGSGRRSGGSEAGAAGGDGQVKLTYTATPPVISQTAYIFTNDNGTTTDTYTQSHSAATSTAITGVKKGEKLIARIQIDNTGTGTSTTQYRLQWENQTDAEGTWTDLSTTTQIRWELSEKAALPGRSGQVPLTTKQVGNCTTTTTFMSGLFVAGTATSTVLTLGPTKCTELAYAIETSGATLNKTYRLRLVTGSTTSALDAYTKYPTFTIESAQDLRYSKEVKGGYSTTTLDSLGDVGFTSIAIGVDGFPVIAYYDSVNGNLNFAKCNNVPCSSYSTSTIDTGGDVGNYSALAIGSDGFPVIFYHNTGGASAFAKCNNISCSSVATSTIDNLGGKFSSMAIGSDGFPVIFYSNGTSEIHFAKCNNIACTSVATSSLTSEGQVGDGNSMAIGSDGFPVVAYYRDSNGNFLYFGKCNNVSCSSFSTSTIDTPSHPFGSANSSMAIGSDGFPVIAYSIPATGELKFAKCNNLSCSSKTISSLDTGDDVGSFSSMAIGSDGFPDRKSACRERVFRAV
jgi:hypothetical protein